MATGCSAAIGSVAVEFAEGAAAGEGEGVGLGEMGTGEGPSSTATVAGVVFEPPPQAASIAATMTQMTSVEWMRISIQTPNAARWFRAAGVG